VLADLLKAFREQDFPEIRRPIRQVLVNPTISELLEWEQRPALQYACDIETKGKMIDMIGFSRSPSEAIIIPFLTDDLANPHYWSTLGQELAAWQVAQRLLESSVPKIFQNGLYDLQYIARMGIRPRACTEDTMLLHHSLYPEMQKGLGFLGSIYTNEASWKLMRHSKAEESLKRDE
jgi:DNA polymerase I-like protein with 3'-5' exonuclease and polymerase domains